MSATKREAELEAEIERLRHALGAFLDSDEASAAAIGATDDLETQVRLTLAHMRVRDAARDALNRSLAS